MKQNKVLGVIFILIMLFALFTSVACAVDEYQDRDIKIRQTNFPDSMYEEWKIRAENGFICTDYNISQKSDGTYIVTLKFNN